MSQCRFEYVDGSEWSYRCARCGFTDRFKVEQDPDGLHRNCPAGGLGDLVAWALAAVGVTKERYSRLLGRPCGCAARQEKLNRWGERLAGWWKRISQG